jgi:hypothetical protein
MNRKTIYSWLSVLVACSAAREAHAQPANCTSGNNTEYCWQFGNSTSGYTALQGTSTDGQGVLGNDQGSGTGVVGLSGLDLTASSSGYGVYGGSTNNDGVHGTVDSSYSGVAGENTGSGTGVYGSATGNDGVYGVTTELTTYAGVYGFANVSGGGGTGVAGTCNSGACTGGYFRTYGGSGVYAVNQGTSSNGYGVYAYDASSGTGGGYAMYATSTNGIGIQTTGATQGVYATSTGTNSDGVYTTCSGTGCAALYVDGALSLLGNGTYSGTWTHTSDERLKRDIAPLNRSVDKLLRLQGVSFYWKDPAKHGDNAQIQRGFVAQDYEKVFPEWVTTDREGFKAIDTTGLDALEVEAIRTLKMQNDFLAAQVKELQSGRRPVVSGVDLNGVGFGVGGLAIGVGLVFVARRKREEQPRTIA